MWAPTSRAFSSTAIASGSPPRSFCSCASLSAADIPAGPPPTMRTSTSSDSRVTQLSVFQLSAFSSQHSARRFNYLAGVLNRDGSLTADRCELTAVSLVQFRHDRRHDLEQVPGDAEVGDLENRRFRVLVDGHDGPRTLHPNEMLDRAGDPKGDVQLRGEVLP